jgi:hypothetical protein
MAGPRKPRKAGARRGILGRLKPEEAEVVLRRLLKAHPELAPEAKEAAKECLVEVAFESVADEVEEAVTALDLDDLGSRAGRHSWGYTSPTEAAGELLEESVEPFMSDMKRLAALGLAAAALETCKGIVLGLYWARDRSGSGVLEWAQDFPEETAAEALCSWREGRGFRRRARDELLNGFAPTHAPEWADLVARALLED